MRLALAGIAPAGGRECYSHLEQDARRSARLEAEPGPAQSLFCSLRPAPWLACLLAAALLAATSAAAAAGWRPLRLMAPQASIQASETPDGAVTEWEVVFGGSPRIESLDTYWNAVVLDRKTKGTVLLGQKEGAWLRLACEPGFMRIQLGFPAVPMLQARGHHFVHSEDSCENSGKQPVLSRSECQRAKENLGVPGHLSATVVDGPADGCHVFLDFPNVSGPPAGEQVRFLMSDSGRPSALKHEICYDKAKTCESVRTSTSTSTVTTTVTTTTSTTTTLPYLPCSWAGENCRSTGCCNQPGMSCFERDSEWATCNHTCAKGRREGKGGAQWSCHVLGGSVRMEDLLGKCRWSGDDCSESRCCLQPGHRCYRKSGRWAGCLRSCNGSDAEGWDCAEVGGRRPAAPVLARAPRAGAAGTTLFCFAAPGSGKEWQLLSLAEERQVGIFGCEGSLSFDLDQNAGALGAWRELLKEGEYKKYDWTVMVAPDAVFFPDRLRETLRSLAPPKNVSALLRQEDDDALAGIHVLSTAAADVLVQYGAMCSDGPGLSDPGAQAAAHGLASAGAFLRGCLAVLGAGEVVTSRITVENSADWGAESTEWCAEGSAVALHAPGRASIWTDCFNTAAASR